MKLVSTDTPVDQDGSVVLHKSVSPVELLDIHSTFHVECAELFVSNEQTTKTFDVTNATGNTMSTVISVAVAVTVPVVRTAPLYAVPASTVAVPVFTPVLFILIRPT